MKKLTKNIDYVEFYAGKLKLNNFYFAQQKKLIESQLKISSLLFKNMFGEKDEFKKNARKYLYGVGIIKKIKIKW